MCVCVYNVCLRKSWPSCEFIYLSHIKGSFRQYLRSMGTKINFGSLYIDMKQRLRIQFITSCFSLVVCTGVIFINRCMSLRMVKLY